MISAFHDPFMRSALVASLAVGIVCAYLGVHVVLRRVVFVGATLAQVSAAGIGLALLLGLNPWPVSIALMLVGVAIFSLRSADRRVTRESLIGVGYVVASALAVLFVAKSAQGEAHLLDMLSGNILTVTSRQIIAMAVVAVVVGALHLGFGKQFLFTGLDPDMARTAGFKAGLWDLFFFLTLGVTIVFAIQIAGALLVFAFLVAPAVTALLITEKLSRAYIAAIIAAVVATVAGLHLSFLPALDLPSGPAIVVVLFTILALVAAWTRVR
ncbi:MAG: metal ABC transporter permease [Armatimonadetes bacterium]|nr:metal ABC transporter permease [Armatimonadota bacterium]